MEPKETETPDDEGFGVWLRILTFGPVVLISLLGLTKGELAAVLFLGSATAVMGFIYLLQLEYGPIDVDSPQIVEKRKRMGWAEIADFVVWYGASLAVYAWIVL